MLKVLFAACVGSLAAFAAGGASANDELNRLSQNPKDWVMRRATTPILAIQSSTRSRRPMSANCSRMDLLDRRTPRP